MRGKTKSGSGKWSQIMKEDGRVEDLQASMYYNGQKVFIMPGTLELDKGLAVTLELSEYIPYQACAVWEIDPYTVRSTATKGVACNFHIFDPEFDFAAATRIVEEVHELATYWEGEFTPLTKVTTEENVFAAWELSLENCGAIYIFRREICEEDTFVVGFTSVEKESENVPA